jgi:mucin-19
VIASLNISTTERIKSAGWAICLFALLITGRSTTIGRFGGQSPRVRATGGASAVSSDLTQNVITTVVGGGFSLWGENNSPATVSSLYYPYDVDVDGNGNTFIADWNNARIRKVNAEGIITTVAGRGAIGDAVLSADLYGPNGIGLDTAGNLYIAETNNHRIRKLTPNGVMTTVAGSGTNGFSGDGGLAASAQLSYPNDVAADAAGNLFIADTANNRIRKITPGGIISTVAGTGVAGFSGDGGAAISAKLSGPAGLAVDGAGNLLIADTNNNRIRMMSLAGVINTIAGTGAAGFAGDGGPAVAAQLKFPIGLAMDGAGNLFFSDAGNNRIRRVNGGGVIQTVAGVGKAGFSGDGGPAIAAQLGGPRGIAVDGSGALLIADVDNSRIRKVQAVSPGTPAITSMVPSTGVLGSVMPARITGVNLTGATAVSFSGTGVTAAISNIDPGGASLTVNITIAPNAALTMRTVRITASSGQSEFFAGFAVSVPVDDRVVNTIAGTGQPGFNGDGPAISSQLNGPTSVAIDSAGNMFVADSLNNRIRKIRSDGVMVTVAGTGVAGFSGDGSSAISAQLNRPVAVAVDALGNLFIADRFNNRIRKVNAAGQISTIAGNGSGGFSGDDGLATAASLNGPQSIALDSAGNLFVADTANNRVRLINPSGVITTVVGPTFGFKGDGGPVNKAQIAGPTRVAISPTGDLFFIDELNKRVRKVNSMGIISTVAGNGGQGFDDTDGKPATSVQTYPVAIAFDLTGNLLISDEHRGIRRVDSSGAIFTIARVGAFAITADATGALLIAGDQAIQSVSAAGGGSGAPSISSISVSSALQGATVSATLSGFNLSAANGVIFSGTGVSAAISIGGTSTSLPITISIAPGAATGLRTVTVTTATHSSNALAGFTVTAPQPPGPPMIFSNIDGTPTISVLNALQGTSVAAMILGSNLNGATAVNFSGSGVSATVLNGGTDTTVPIWIYIDPGATLGNHSFTVTAATGVSDPRNGFNVLPAAAGDIITTAAGIMCCGSGGSGHPAISTPIRSPGGITADRAGNIFFAETEGQHIRRINPFGIMDTVAGALTISGFFGDGGPATQALLSNPSDVAVDFQGNIYISDSGNGRVRKVNPSGVISTIAGTGAGDFGGDGGPATAASFLALGRIAADTNGNLFIADWSRVRMVNAAGVISTIAGDGTTGFGGDGGPATSAQLSTVTGIAIDGSHNIFIADHGNDRIRMVNAAGIITTIAGNGTTGSAGDGGPAVSAQLFHPMDVAVDSSGNLFITEITNRVRMVNTSGVISTFAGTGVGGFSGDFGPATSAQLEFPSGITADPLGNVWISDTTNNRIRTVTRGAPPTPSITSISVPSAVQGSVVAATITGVNLSGAASVTLTGTGVNAVISSGGTDTSIPVTITIDPAAPPGLRTIYIITRGSISPGFSGFTVNVTSVPRVTSISPPSAAQGAMLGATLSGTNLTGATSVTFDGAGVSAEISGGGSDSTLPVMLTIAANASTGLRKVTVTTPNGESTPFGGFTVDPSTPGITSISVLSAAQATTVAAVISGTNLAGVTSVVFSGAGVTANISGAATATSLPVTISIASTAAPGPRSLTLATSDRISVPFDGFAVTATTAPTITSISPGVALTGSTIAAVIVGVNLNSATGVAFSGTGVTGVLTGGADNTKRPVSITVAPGAPVGSRTVTVNTAGGPSNALDGFIVQQGTPIRITSISTKSAPQGGGFSATIYGANLAGATAVVFSGAGVTASISANSATSVQINGNVALNAATGERTVTVVTAAGSSDPYSSLRVTLPSRPSVIQTVLGTGISGYSGDNSNPARLYWPTGMAVDAAGNVFIADFGNNRIRKLTPNFVISTVAGTGAAGHGGDGGLATSATLNGPIAVAVDSSGNLFIVDSNNHCIRKVSPDGVITTVAGNGVAGFSGDGGVATNARLNFPNSVAVDGSGALFIADTENARVRKVNTNGVIQTIAGTGAQGFSGDGGPAVAAKLFDPAAVAVDGAGSVYIADFSNHRVRKVTPDGLIATIAGTGIAGFSGDTGPATSAQLNGPNDVKLDASGNVFIADYFNNRIRKIGPTGAIGAVAGIGFAFFSGDGGPATAAQLNGPFGVAIGVTGDILIADVNNSRVRQVNAAGIISTLAGDGGLGFNGDGPAFLFAQIYNSADAAMDAAGNLFVADTFNQRIRKVTPAGVVSTIAGTNNTGFSGDGGPATSALLWFPTSVAVDGAGNVFIGDVFNERIRKITSNGIITTVAGNGVPGFSGDGGPAVIAQISNPVGLATDTAGNLFIADSNNHRIRMVTPTGVITTVAGSGDAGFSGDGGPAGSAKLNHPTGVAIDSSGNIFIADSDNNRIRRVDPAGMISTFAGTGVADFGGDDEPAITAQLNLPRDVVVDNAGNVFISDSNNARVRMVNLLGQISTVAGTGVAGFSGDGGPAYAAQIAASALGIDGAGNLLIVDAGRIRRVTFTPVANLSAITSISPFSAAQGSMVAATISGSSLNGATAVNFSGAGVTASIGLGGTATTLPVTISVSAGAALGTRTFSVVNPAGASDAFNGFTVKSSNPVATVTSITPAKGIIGTTIPATIMGTALTGATAVTFSGSGVTAVIVAGGTDSSLPISITIAANASLDTRIFTVATPAGTSAAFNGFTVARPTITGISPAMGTAGFSLAVTISGTNLTGANAVAFSGSGVTGVVGPGVTETSAPVVITIAAGAAPGVRDVTVATPDATSTPFSGFAVVAPGPSGVITTFAGDGTTDFKGDGGPAIYAGLYAAAYVAVDGAGNVYIADANHNRIRKVTPDGVINTIAGTGEYGFSGDGGLATLAKIHAPAGIAVDGAGNLFFADHDSNRVRKVAPNGVIDTVAGNGMTGFGGDGGPAILATVDSPTEIALDKAGNLYIADHFNHRIRRVATDGIITTVAGNGGIGSTGDGGPATSATLVDPVGIAVDGTGALYIADSDAERIRKVTTDGVIHTIAGGAAACCFSGDGGPAILAALHNPINVTIDNSGNVLIVDTGNRRIRRIDSSGNINTIAGNGELSFSGDGGPAISAGFNPTDVAVDAGGNLFIADFDHYRIRKVTYGPAGRKGRGQLTSQ